LKIRAFEASDYVAARALWERTEGVGLSSADERDAICAFLARNPNMSFVAVDEEIVGTILCGHDGRRGLIHHLVTAPTHRRRGIGTALLHRSLGTLHREGIAKCHLLVFRSNEAGMAFWRKIGAEERESLAIFSIATSNDG
jgi:ribosomal protein S18 acetylase RimI-like enzyme